LVSPFIAFKNNPFLYLKMNKFVGNNNDLRVRNDFALTPALSVG